jgi:hypothetical protein
MQPAALQRGGDDGEGRGAAGFGKGRVRANGGALHVESS